MSTEAPRRNEAHQEWRARFYACSCQRDWYEQEGFLGEAQWASEFCPQHGKPEFSAEAFEVLPTALVDAVLDAAYAVVVHSELSGPVTYLAGTHADLEAYRAPVLLGQDEETLR